MTRLLPIIALGLLLCACGPSGNAPANVPVMGVSAAAEDLRRQAAALLARPEIDVEEVTVQHCLIAVRNRGPFVDKPSLSHLEAEERAAQLLIRAQRGDDFRLIVLENTYDHIQSETEPGVYIMVRPKDMKIPPPDRPKLDPEKPMYYRDEMTLWFSMAAWRLQVGEIGVIEKSGENSPYGFHIIKRLK